MQAFILNENNNENEINSHKILITAVVITRLISVVMKLLIVRISGVRMRQKFLL